MKFVLRERKTLQEDKNQKAALVSVSPHYFLELTMPPDGADVAKRAEKMGAYREDAAGILDLNIGSDGRVKSHEGRARCVAAIKAGIKAVKVRMELDNNAKSWTGFPEVFTGQFDEGVKVEKKHFHLLQDADAATDVSDELKNAVYMVAHKDARTGEYRLGGLRSQYRNILSAYAGSSALSIDGVNKALYISVGGENPRPVSDEEKKQLQSAGVKIK
jgi:hypothetical protein